MGGTGPSPHCSHVMVWKTYKNSVQFIRKSVGLNYRDGATTFISLFRWCYQLYTYMYISYIRFTAVEVTFANFHDRTCEQYRE